MPRLVRVLGLLEDGLEGEGDEEVALAGVELGLELHPVQPKYKFNSIQKKLNKVSLGKIVFVIFKECININFIKQYLVLQS